MRGSGIMRKERKKEGERLTAGVFSFALMYMESTEYTSCSSGCRSLIVLIKTIVGVGIEFYLNIQFFRILSHTNNVTEWHFDHDHDAKHQTKRICIFLCLSVAVSLKGVRAFPCASHIQKCALKQKAAMMTTSSGVRGCVIGSLPCVFSLHMKMALMRIFTPISPCAQLPRPLASV